MIEAQQQISHYIRQEATYQDQQELLDPRDGYAIPLQDICSMLQSFPYGNQFRAMTFFMILTGCRISELDNMCTTGLIGNYFYWKTGKNQKTHRCEYIPDYLIKEYQYCRYTNPIPGSKMWGVTAKTYARWFNKLREDMPTKWQKKCLLPVTQRRDGQNNLKMYKEYVYQMKGLRKTFATFTFLKYWKQYNSAEVAAVMTAKHMKHSTKEMTCRHYVEQCLIYKQYEGMELWQALKIDGQQRLITCTN